MWSSTLLLPIPQLSSSTGPIPVQSPAGDQCTPEAHLPSLTHSLPPAEGRECADITPLSISQGLTYCLEAAKVTYKCKYSWVLLNLSTTWEQRSSASVRGCLDFSSRTQPWVILVLTQKFHFLGKFELINSIFLSLAFSFIAWGRVCCIGSFFLVAISQNNHTVLQTY